MTKTMKLNGTTVVPVSGIRRIKPLTEEDHARIAERYDNPEKAKRFQLQIEFADKSTKLAAESLDDLRAQGVALVNLGSDRYVPAQNIKFAETLSKDELDGMKDRFDNNLSTTFRSRVETTAGTMLSSATPQQVIERREKAIETASTNAKPANTNRKPAVPRAEAS